MKKFGLPILFLLPVAAFSQSISPSVIGSAGDFFVLGNNRLDWTIGEPITETFSLPNFTATEGFHQPAFNHVGVEDLAKNQCDFSIFPNPAGEWLYLAGNFSSYSDLKIHDASARAVLEESGRDMTVPIVVSGLSPGIYMIRIRDCRGEFRSLKWVKE